MPRDVAGKGEPALLLLFPQLPVCFPGLVTNHPKIPFPDGFLQRLSVWDGVFQERQLKNAPVRWFKNVSSQIKDLFSSNELFQGARNKTETLWGFVGVTSSVLQLYTMGEVHFWPGTELGTSFK